MTLTEELMDSIDIRLEAYDLCGVDTDPGEPFSYELNEPVLLLLRLRDDCDDIRDAKSDVEALEIWKQVRPFVLAFHVGGMH